MNRFGEGTTRRNILVGAAVSVAVLPLQGAEARAPEKPSVAPRGSAITLNVNGQDHHLALDRRTSLLDALREYLGLSGTKKGCDQGACGACTILVDGNRIISCLALAVQYQGRVITTIEGIGSATDLHPLQSAFVEHDGLQCGYCTPGQICSAIGMAAELKRGLPSAVTDDLLTEKINFSSDEVRERMSGNICRCGAYNGIVEAVRATFAEEANL
jgi:xanthine dehydrogenase YagT iron-sulfur-binding subunit